MFYAHLPYVHLLSLNSLVFLNIFLPVESMREGKETGFPHLKKPDDVDVTIELRDWLFALEGAQDMAERWWFSSHENEGREERCWHTSFHGLQVNAKNRPKNVSDGKGQLHRIQHHPVELVTVNTCFFLIFQDLMFGCINFCSKLLQN